MNALGYLRVMFAVDDLDDTLARLRRHGAQLVDELVQYEACIGSATSEAPRGFSSGWPSRSAKRVELSRRRAPQASFPNAGPPERRPRLHR